MPQFILFEGNVEMIQQVDAIVIFFPPYLPDFNPIEEWFSKVKKKIKWYESNLHSNEMDLQTVVYTNFFCHVTPEDCCGWIASSDIYHMDQD